MEKILDFLTDLHLSEIEAKLYITLLESGPASVRDIAQKIGLKRTTSYFYIENLMKKGLITKTVINSHSQICPINPKDGLTALVKENIEITKDIEIKLREVVESIHSSFPNFKEIEKFEIKYYKGVSGVKKVYDDALSSNELRSYVKMIDDDAIFTDNVGMFETAFKKNPNLRVREILYQASNASKEAQQIVSTYDNYSYKFMPEDMKLTSEDILIYDGRVAIIHYRGKENCNSVILQSDDYYKNSVEFFDFIWKVIPEVTR